MSLPPIPPQLEHLAARSFSFYPPILNIEHNEWLFRKATWSEILVINTKDNRELWIPRRFVGEISRVEDPVMIVGLVKELEYKGGAVWPYQRRVIEMPVAVGDTANRTYPPEETSEPAPVIGIRVERSESRMLRMIGGTVLCAVLAWVVVANVFRTGVLRPRLTYTTRDQSYLELTSHDDYFDVTRKLGEPYSDRWQSESGEIQYRALSYPQRAYTVILMGTDRKAVRYIGTVDQNWNPVHAVEIRGGNTFSMLRGLKRF
jgi:hypothetical protein